MTKLKALRLEKDLKGFQLSISTGIHPSIISHVESKRIKASGNVRMKLANFYGKNENELFDDDNFAI